jgi:hypothetical protein
MIRDWDKVSTIGGSMAYYLVKAQPKTELLTELEGELEGRKFESLRPFGRSLTYSLNNARLRGDGIATWEEEDYCSPPLTQERAAVLDKYFMDLSVVRVEKGRGWEKVESLPHLFPELMVRG